MAQARTAWANFEEDLGKTIATSPVLKAGLDGIYQGIQTAFGGSQQALIDAIAQKVEHVELVIVELARGGVAAGGVLATEWYALQKVMGDVAQIVQGNALAFEYAALGVAKATAAVNLTSEGQRRAAEDVERIQNNITSLLVTMKARGDALQAADAAQKGVNATTDKYKDLLDAVIARMQSAKEGSAASVSALDAEAHAHTQAGDAAGRHAAMLQASKQEMSDAARAAKEIAAAQKEAFDATIPLTAAQQAEVTSLLALGVSHKSIAIDVGATEAQIRRFVATVKDHNEALKLADEIAAKFTTEGNKHWKEWFDFVAKRLTETNKLVVSTFDGLVKAQRDYHEAIAKDTLSADDFERYQLEQQLENAKVKLRELGDSYQATYDEIAKTIGVKLSEIGTLWQEHPMFPPKASFDAKQQVESFSGVLGGVVTTLDQLSQTSSGTFNGIVHEIQLAVKAAEALGKALQASGVGGGAPDGSQSGGGQTGGLMGIAGVTALIPVVGAWIAVGIAVYAFISALNQAAEDAEKLERIANTLQHVDIAFQSATNFSDALAQSITKTAEDFAHITALNTKFSDFVNASGMTIQTLAESAHLADIIKELGGVSALTASQLDMVRDRLSGLYTLIALGGPIAQQALTTLDDTLSELATTDQYGRFSDLFKDLVDQARQAGVELPKGRRDHQAASRECRRWTQ